MSTYKRLVRRLSPVFGVDEGITPVLEITCSTASYIEVSDDTLYVSDSSSQSSFALNNFTISSLATSLNQISGVTAVVLASGSASADLLLDIKSANVSSITLNADTSTNGIVLRSRAASLNATEQALQAAISQLNPYSASSLWLDFWGDILGVPRYQNEPDQLYAQRMLKLRFGYRVNNYAIEDFFVAMGYGATAVDGTTAGTGTLDISLPLKAPQGFSYSLAQLQDMLRVLKPFDSIITIVVSGTLQDTTKITESLSANLKSKNWTYSSFTWGQFNW